MTIKHNWRILIAVAIILLMAAIACTAAIETATPEPTETPPPSETEPATVAPTDEPTATEPATETNQPTEPPTQPAGDTATPTPTLTPTPQGTVTPGPIAGDNLLALPNGNGTSTPVVESMVEVLEMRDPHLNPRVVGYPHYAPFGSQVWYAADNYYCDPLLTWVPTMNNCEAPHSDGDPEVRMGRPEYTFGRCPPLDDPACEDNAQLFLYRRPGVAGWQWWIDLKAPSNRVEAVSGDRRVELCWAAYIWAADPASSDWQHSGAITGKTEDDRKSAGMLAALSDNWMYRDHQWLDQRDYNYPAYPVQPTASQPEALPIDRWATYCEDFTLPAGTDHFVAAVGANFRWGWPNNFYIRDLKLVVDGVYWQPPITPTPIAEGSIPGDEATPIAGPFGTPSGPKSYQTDDLPIGSTITTNYVMKIRSTPDASINTNVVGQWGPGSRTAYGIITYEGNTWVCLDDGCDQVVAKVLDNIEYATVQTPEVPLVAPMALISGIPEGDFSMLEFLDWLMHSPDVAAFVVELLLIVIAAGTVIAAVISGLKAKGVIDDGRAGVWNVGISAVIALATFILSLLGVKPDMKSIGDAAATVSSAVVLCVVYALSSKFMYKILKWLGIAYSYPEPEPAGLIAFAEAKRNKVSIGATVPTGMMNPDPGPAKPAPKPPVEPYTARDRFIPLDDEDEEKTATPSA